MSITQKDIAKKLKISKATVSRALLNDPKINIKTRKKVHETAKKLNYYPNLVAKSLRMKRTNFIGVIVSDISNPFFPEVIEGIATEANREKFHIIFGNTKYNVEIETDYIEFFISHKVEGVIVATAISNRSLKILEANKIPFVLVDIKPIEKNKVNTIYFNQEEGGYIATKHLLSLGHSKIALINGPEEISSSKFFKKGYLKALKEFNINVKPSYIKEEKINMTIIGGFKKVEGFLALKEDEIPTAFMFISDMAALGGYRAINKYGYKIPNDFSIIGNDDIFFAKDFMPPLTTISYKNYKLGEESFKILLDIIENKNTYKPTQYKLPPKLVIRESTTKLS